MSSRTATPFGSRRLSPGTNRRSCATIRNVECEVAREALSARIDGEREPVPAARVDEHLADCAGCRRWYDQVSGQAALLRRLAADPVALAPTARRTRGLRLPTLAWPRWALLAVGVVQLVLAAAQAFGSSLGLAHHHGATTGGHLMNESTAWSLAVGVVMVGAALWPGAAAGLAGVLTAFAAVLTAYVIADAAAGAVTLERIFTHLPILLGALLALLVWRRAPGSRPRPSTAADEPDITLPHNASHGRQRGHLWSADGAA